MRALLSPLTEFAHADPAPLHAKSLLNNPLPPPTTFEELNAFVSQVRGQRDGVVSPRPPRW